MRRRVRCARVRTQPMIAQYLFKYNNIHKHFNNIIHYNINIPSKLTLYNAAQLCYTTTHAGRQKFAAHKHTHTSRALL